MVANNFSSISKPSNGYYQPEAATSLPFRLINGQPGQSLTGRRQTPITHTTRICGQYFNRILKKCKHSG